MSGVGRLIGALAGSLAMGLVSFSAQASPIITVLNDDDAWSAVLSPASTSLPTGAVMARTIVYGSTSSQFRSPWDQDALGPNGETETGASGDASIDIDTIGYWSFGPSPAANNPNPGVLKLNAVYDTIQFLWGSVDTYNILTFLSGGASVGSISGDVLIDDHNSTAGAGAALVTIFIAGGFDTLQFYSDQQNAFEVSNFYVEPDSAIGAIPVPPAVLLLGSALGGLGLIAARRRRETAIAS